MFRKAFRLELGDWITNTGPVAAFAAHAYGCMLAFDWGSQWALTPTHRVGVYCTAAGGLPAACTQPRLAWGGACEGPAQIR